MENWKKLGDAVQTIMERLMRRKRKRDRDLAIVCVEADGTRIVGGSR